MQGETGDQQAPIDADALLWLLGSLCGLYRIPFDAALVSQQFPPPYSRTTFHEAARSIGLKTGTGPLPAADWTRQPLPCIAFLKAEGESAAVPVLILKTDGHKLLYFRPGAQTPETITAEAARERFEPELILVAREHSGETATGEQEDIPGFTADKPEFGFRWFVPELLKHKAIWRDVLLASLAIQLVGLATPLFTQVIIDKVVVHQTNSTLTQ